MVIEQIHVRQANWLEDGLALRAIRKTVFIDEQNVPVELEWDGLDADCFHVLAVDASGKPVGTARLQLNGHIGRMAVLKEWRKQGVGSALLRRLLTEISNRGIQQAALNAQTDAVRFYQKFGFQIVGDEFMDAGIPHVHMILKV